MWNSIKTVVLLTFLSGILLGLGGLIGGYHGIQIALIIALLMNGISYYFSDKIVLSLYGAQKLDPVQYHEIYTIVGELAGTMQLPMPTLWLIRTPMANAFATGRSPSHAAVAVTTGILSLLEQHELRGVLAHELSHIKNRDVLVTTIAATIATAIGYIAHMMQYAVLFGSRDRRDRSNPFGMIIVAILMPIAATLLQLSLSRSREYLADQTGAACCNDPLALASALRKLHGYLPHAHLNEHDIRHASTASLFIMHPFSSQGLSALFSTHPPVEERIKRLETIHLQKK